MDTSTAVLIAAGAIATVLGFGAAINAVFAEDTRNSSILDLSSPAPEPATRLHNGDAANADTGSRR